MVHVPAALDRSRRTGIALVDTRVTSIKDPRRGIHGNLETAEVHPGGGVLQLLATSLVAGISECLACRIELVKFEDHTVDSRKVIVFLIRLDSVDRQFGLVPELVKVVL